MSRSSWISVASGSHGTIKQALNAGGWLDGEVIAAGQLRQGEPPSLLAMASGLALIELARPKRSRALPRQFVLAATADRVFAFKSVGGSRGEADVASYTVRIKPGPWASWPRSSVRLVDLPDGAQSAGGTLELAGTERFPVSRPNLNGDPSTDELIDLLSGGARGTRESRDLEDQDDLRRAGGVRPGDYRELAADARRGRPAVDLAGWAERRGLRFRGGASQAGHLSITCPWSDDLLFNVVRGRWPSGLDGVLCHEARIYAEDARGFFHGGERSGGTAGSRISDLLNPLPVGGGERAYFKVPYTSAGARVPHLATVTGLHVARRAERHTETDTLLGTWQARSLDHRGLRDRWMAAVRTHSDEATVERILAGPVRELLSAQQGLGFEIRIEYGQVIVSRQDFLKRDDDLDALVAAADALARAVRDICVPSNAVHPLATQLPAPEWLAAVRRHPKRKHTSWPIGARLEQVVKVADERGMAVEDPRAFHAAFPGINVPGEPFGVLHGRLPGTALIGRLLCCAERPMDLPDDFRAFLTNPGGPAGSDVAVVAVDRDASATSPDGEVEDGVRVAIADGVLTAWRLRPRWQADGAALDRLAADVAAIMRRRGLSGGR
jgi:hypothetical protein